MFSKIKKNENNSIVGASTVDQHANPPDAALRSHMDTNSSPAVPLSIQLPVHRLGK